MCDSILRNYGCVAIYTIAKQLCVGYVNFQRMNKKVVRRQMKVGRAPGLRPFQNIQLDFIEMPRVG
jgi:hypothetical protein